MRRRRPRLYAPESIESVIDRAGEDRFAHTRPPISARVWSEAVGARIAERAKPITLERGTLTIRAATSVWASELSLLSDALLKRLRAAGVAVRELRFRVGPVEPPARPPERRIARRGPPPRPLEGELAADVASVPDEELRAVISAAARANLAWQEHLDKSRAAPVSEAPRAVRAPRAAETETAPPARTSRAFRGAARGTRGDE
jgi:hypothetical protein